MRRAVLGCLAVLGAFVLATSSLGPASAATSLESAQYRLQKFGCEPGGITGQANDRTKWAIVKFQAANGLTQSGKLTDLTRAKLAKPTAIACDNRPVPSGTGTGKRIVMSQKQNWIWLVRADGSVAWQSGVIDNPYIVQPGVHYTGSKCGRPAKILHNRSYDETLILDHYVRFVACGVGFHRVPTYVTNGQQIHADYLLGTDAMTSHGCVRMSAEAAKRLWYFVGSASTKVVVVADR
jgi:hypothetical protein